MLKLQRLLLIFSLKDLKSHTCNYVSTNIRRRGQQKKMKILYIFNSLNSQHNKKKITLNGQWLHSYVKITLLSATELCVVTNNQNVLKISSVILRFTILLNFPSNMNISIIYSEILSPTILLSFQNFKKENIPKHQTFQIILAHCNHKFNSKN